MRSNDNHLGGRGVTNYNIDKPSHAITDKTTEFDDELIRRGIVTQEQCIIAKGATPQEAHRIIQHKNKIANQCKGNGSDVCSINSSKILHCCHFKCNSSDSDTEHHDDSLFENDEEYHGTIERYREMRLREMRGEAQRTYSDGKRRSIGKEEDDGAAGIAEAALDRNVRLSKMMYGEVLLISRSDWAREVNDASLNGQWVLVHLLCDLIEECVLLQRSLEQLASKHPYIKIVCIPSRSAIENWPDDSRGHLPAIFLYRDGVMQHQIIGFDCFGIEGGGEMGVTLEGLEKILTERFDVLQT